MKQELNTNCNNAQNKKAENATVRLQIQLVIKDYKATKNTSHLHFRSNLNFNYYDRIN